LAKKLPYFLILVMVFTMFSGVETNKFKTVFAENENNNLMFDFGSDSSPVAIGYTKVSNTSLYEASKGFGLNMSVNFRDRENPDDIRRDFVFSSNNYQFKVDIPSGDYFVKIIAGDHIASNRTGITIEEINKGSISSSKGEFTEFGEIISIKDGQLNVAFSGKDARVNGIEIFPMAAPTELRLESKTLLPITSVTLNWNEVNGAIGYNIYRKTEEDHEFKKIGTSKSVKFTDDTVELGLTYTYAVTQINSVSIESSKSNELSVLMIDESVEIPNAPSSLEIDYALEDSITLKWTAVDNTAKYYIYRAKTENGTYSKVGVSSKATFTDGNVITNNQFYYRVKAVNLGGLSDPSDILKSPITKVTLRRMEHLNRNQNR
jgi:fibronectin type 3 domain-containing protein